MKRTDSISHTIRFPIEIYNFARAKAAEEHRTFNGQILHFMIVAIKTLYKDARVEKPDEDLDD